MASIPQVVAAGAAGVLIHNLTFIRGEWHLRAMKVLIIHGLTYMTLILFESIYNESSWLAATKIISQIFSVYILFLLGSISIYRVFFHRLRNFPGPFLASVSKFWHVAHCLDSKNHTLLAKLHREYGDFVRIGMALEVWQVIPD